MQIVKNIIDLNNTLKSSKKEEIKLAKIIIDNVKGEMLSGIVRNVFRSIIT